MYQFFCILRLLIFTPLIYVAKFWTMYGTNMMYLRLGLLPITSPPRSIATVYGSSSVVESAVVLTWNGIFMQFLAY